MCAPLTTVFEYLLACKLTNDGAAKLMKEADELTAIFVASLKTAER
jgi:hypothetical protein